VIAELIRDRASRLFKYKFENGYFTADAERQMIKNNNVVKAYIQLLYDKNAYLNNFSSLSKENLDENDNYFSVHNNEFPIVCLRISIPII
jgi:hypothetical protein